MDNNRLKRWNGHRRAIALVEEPDNDMGYTLIGARSAFNISKIIGKFFNTHPFPIIKNWKVLDYGCGTGRTTRPLSYICGSIVGFDPNLKCIDQAKKETKENCSHENVKRGMSRILFTNSLNEIEGEYDLVFSEMVLEHLTVRDKLEMMENCYSFLKEKGIMIHTGHANKCFPIIGLSEKIEQGKKKYGNYWIKKDNKLNLIDF